MAKMNPSKLRNVLEALPSCYLSNTKKEAVEAIITKYLEGDIVSAVHGRWIPIVEKVWNLDIPVVVDWKCSVCNGMGNEDFNYCPNCGAKMDGERITDDGIAD